MAHSSEIERLEVEIRRHNRLYFELKRPELSDYAFDRLVRKLKKLRPDSPVLREIPAERKVGETFPEVLHSSPMLSLDKCYREADLLEWAGKFAGEIVASPKIDGCAVELRYDAKGELVLAATRGNGLRGEDITENARMIRAIPHQILPPLSKGGRGGFEIRGEIFIPLSVFRGFEDAFANPRNLAAGAIKQKDPQKTREYRLAFVAYDGVGEAVATETEKRERLKSFGFPVVESKTVGRGDLQKVYEETLKRRGLFDFEVDGVVFKADVVSEQERLGSTAHHPRYAIAYKFQGDSGVTTLEGVEWSVARTGTITPVGIVKPVKLSGASVTRVSLHNLGMVREMGLRKGARVVMMRRGGVIPHLESVAEKGKGPPILRPSRCPSCGAPTVVRDEFLVCANPRGCARAKVGELEHFMKTIDCEGFGRKLLGRLYAAGFVKDPADFYRLTAADLLEIERMGEVLAAKLIRRIEEKRELDLDVFLRALGIRELAKQTSRLVVGKFRSLDRILEVSQGELADLHGIGPAIAKEVGNGLKGKRGLIDKLLGFVRIRAAREVKKDLRGPLAGKRVCFTGALVAMERSAGEALVEKAGGLASESVTRDLDLLVVGDGGGAGTKLEKARALAAKGGKVRIITEQEFLKLI